MPNQTPSDPAPAACRGLPPVEAFTAAERAALAPYFTNSDGPVFALTGLPEVVKGALFARYSRSAKSLRRLFLDEFAGSVIARGTPENEGGNEGEREPTPDRADPSQKRAEELFERVFIEYGDDSVAQLGGVHLACEGASNVLTKVLERGRLLSYLEQSTRYVPYTDRPNGAWKYHLPAELEGTPFSARARGSMDLAFETYARWIEPMQSYFRERFPIAPGESQGVYARTLRAKALDTLRGLLPAATRSNVGIFGSAQGYEALLLRMRAHPLSEVRGFADAMLCELRKVIPALMKRVDQPERGGAWTRYLADARAATEAEAARWRAAAQPTDHAAGEAGFAESAAEAASGGVRLTDFDPEGEIKVVAAALYPFSSLADEQLLAIARRMSAEERAKVLGAYVGERKNRRHRPGRAFERTAYRFDVLADYGAFRDLQRHRLLTLDWQPLSTRHGCERPPEIDDAGARDDWQRVMDEASALDDDLHAAELSRVAPYVVPMAFRVRFYMDMNAREAMHVIELRTAPQGHPSYRRVCQRMHQLIAEVAGHRAIAAAMLFADHANVELSRLQSERAAEKRQERS